MDSLENSCERCEALEQQTEPLKHLTPAREAHTHTGEWRRRWWRSIVCGVMLLSLLGLAAAPGKAEEVSLTPTVGGRYIPPGVFSQPGGATRPGSSPLGKGRLAGSPSTLVH